MQKVVDTVKDVLPGGSNKAAWMDKGSKTLRVDKAELPVPGDDEVVIKNHAIAVNPVDWKIQDYGMFIQTWPNVLGEDVAGEVHEVGKNVTKFKKGDRVFAHVMSLISSKPRDGGFQLYTSAPASTTAKIPSSLSYKEASVLPLAVDTAGHGLYDSKDKGFFGLPYPSLTPTPNGKTLVIWGGSSSVGALAVQLATASGAKVVATASKRNHDFVEKLGAAAVLDYNDASVVDDVVKAVQTVGGEFIGTYDAISTDDSRKHAIPITEKLGGGIIASTLPAPESGVPANVKFASVFAVNPVNHPLWAEYLTTALEQGKLKAVPEPLVVGKGLEHVQEGLNKNKAGVSAKKVVIEL